MRKRRASLVAGLLFFLLFSSACGEEERTGFELRPSGVRSLDLPGIGKKGGSEPDQVLRRQGSEFLTHVDPEGPAIRFTSLNGKKAPYDPVPLDRHPRSERFPYFTPRVCPYTKDSLFLFLRERKRLYLMDLKGDLTDQWDLERPDGKPHMLYASGREPFERMGDGLLIRSVPRIKAFGPEKKTYFSTPPDLLVMPRDSTVQVRSAGGWPEKYQERNYYDSYPHRTVTERKSGTYLLYSFRASHSLYLYDGTRLVGKREARSRYIEGFDRYDEDSLGNIAYTKRFLATRPGYGDVKEDPYREIYYRQAFHPCSYEDTEKGKVKGPGDQPWSLIVLNEGFEKLGEVRMDPEEHLPGPLLVSRKGLLIPRKGSKKDGQMRFTVFRPSSGS